MIASNIVIPEPLRELRSPEGSHRGLEQGLGTRVRDLLDRLELEAARLEVFRVEHRAYERSLGHVALALVVEHSVHDTLASIFRRLLSHVTEVDGLGVLLGDAWRVCAHGHLCRRVCCFEEFGEGVFVGLSHGTIVPPCARLAQTAARGLPPASSGVPALSCEVLRSAGSRQSLLCARAV